MAYEIAAAGHKSASVKVSYGEPVSELAKAFEKWLDLSERPLYRSACRLTEGIKPTVAEANALLLRFSDHKNISSAGIFVSALYNKSDDPVILYDIDIGKPVDFLGYRSSKMFVNKGRAGYYMGYEGNDVVNFGTAERELGDKAKNTWNFRFGSPKALEHLADFGFVEDEKNRIDKPELFDCRNGDGIFAVDFDRGMLVDTEIGIGVFKNLQETLADDLRRYTHSVKSEALACRDYQKLPGVLDTERICGALKEIAGHDSLIQRTDRRLEKYFWGRKLWAMT